MKIQHKKQITVDGCKYWLYSYKTDSRSNYNQMMCVRKIGDKMPISGITARQDESISDYMLWAEHSVNKYNNQEFES